MPNRITPIVLDPMALDRNHDGFYSKKYLAGHVGGMKNLNRLLREYPDAILPYFGDNEQRAVYSIVDVIKAIRIDQVRILKERNLDFVFNVR